VVLEKDGDQLDRSCEKWESIRVKEDRNIIHTVKSRKDNWIGHILRRNCLLKYLIEGKIEESIEVKGRQRRKRKDLQDNLKETRGYWKLKVTGLCRTPWRTRCGRAMHWS
jgi:hypothetical protein